MKKAVIILIFLIIISISVIYIIYTGLIDCGRVINNIEELIVGFEEEIMLDLLGKYDKGVSDICDVKDYKTRETSFMPGGITHKTTYYVTSCDMEKVSSGLKNPETLSYQKILNYIYISTSDTTKQMLSILKGIYEDDFSEGCDEIKYVASSMFELLTIGTMSMTWVYSEGFYQDCLNETTENQKKNCIIDVLSAQKSAVIYYSYLEYDVNETVCSKNLITQKATFDIDFSDEKNIPICQKIEEYRKELLERVKNSGLNFNQKFTIFSSIYLQEYFLGDKDVSDEYAQRLSSSIKYHRSQ
jgi:hypothetical protein